MKNLKNKLALLLVLVAVYNISFAQTSKKDKQAAKEADIKASVEARKYTILATYVLPQRGGGRSLTSDYDFKVTKDTLVAYLPYFGRAYFDVGYGSNSDGGIKFTSTKFDYKVAEKKKGGWEITIRPNDVKNIAQLLLYISPDGYATLSVNSTNRDYITFDGYLKDSNKK